MVEHLKVMAALSVEPAYASLSVEPPKGSSRACLRILISRAPLPVLALGSASPSGLGFTSFFFDLFEGQISNQRATKVSIYLLGRGAVVEPPVGLGFTSFFLTYLRGK